MGEDVILNFRAPLRRSGSGGEDKPKIGGPPQEGCHPPHLLPPLLRRGSLRRDGYSTKPFEARAEEGGQVFTTPTKRL